MSHSITTAASYVLNKYSRSYPSTSSRQGTRAPAESASEWQHFTNPPMWIILEAKKSHCGQLVSMRLKILWNVHTESDDLHNGQREVIFEDLELLSFSSLPTFQVQLDQGLPLKAVYRDAVVGVRYLHPKIVPPGSQPTYRRFQITFKDVVDASQFIEAIKPVCPCKANPQPTHINRQATMLSTPMTRAATTVSGHAPARSAKLMERQNTIATSIGASPVTSSISNHRPENQVFFIAPSSVTTSLSSDESAFVTCSETPYDAPARMDLPKSRGRDSGQSSLPNSSQPSSSDQSMTMPPPPVPRRPTTHSADVTQGPPGTVNTVDERSQFLSSLSKHPSLSQLSRVELQTLVGQVIREEGFLQLLETMDSLWKEKGFLGRR